MAKRTCDPTINSIGSQTYWLGRNGQIVRARTVPSNPNTSPQTVARASLTVNSRLWNALTDVQRSAWRASAMNVQSRSTLGMSGPLTGIQLFIKLNCNSALLAQGEITDPTAVPSFTPLALSALVITNAADVITIKMTAPADPGEITLLWSAAPTKAGQFRPPELVFMGAAPAPSSGSITITSMYEALFGSPPVGSRVFVGANQMISGWQSQVITFNDLVPAS